MAIAADRTEGGIIIEGVGEDSGEPEWRAVGVGDGCVEWGIGKWRCRVQQKNYWTYQWTLDGRSRFEKKLAS